MESRTKQKCKLCNRFGHSETCTTHQQRFLWKYGGQHCSLVGEWSKFQIFHKMKPVSDNPYFFETFITIQPGIHRYKFMVDGKWRYDPNEDNEVNIFSTYDNIIQVFPAVYEVNTEESDSETKQFYSFSNVGVRVKIKTQLNQPPVFLKGSWDNWGDTIQIKHNKAYLRLYPGIYHFKFIVDGIWMIDESLMRCDDGVGGYNNVIKVCKKETPLKWDPTELEWSMRKEDGLNFTAIQGHTMNMIGNSIYIFGGMYHNRFLDSMYIIDIEESEVQNCISSGVVPEARAYHQSIEYGNKIIIFGGLNQKSRTKIEGETPSPRERCTLTKINDDMLVLFGGYECSEDETVEINYQETFSLNLIKLEWEKITTTGPIPKARSCHVAGSYKQSLYVFGGVHRNISDDDLLFSDVWRLDFEAMVWKDKTEQIKGQPPVARYGHASTQIQNFMIVYGGKDQQENLLRDVWILDMYQLNWVQPRISGVDPGARWYHAFCCNENNDIFMLGGFKGKFFDRQRAIYKLSTKKS